MSAKKYLTDCWEIQSNGSNLEIKDYANWLSYIFWTWNNQSRKKTIFRDIFKYKIGEELKFAVRKGKHVRKLIKDLPEMGFPLFQAEAFFCTPPNKK